MYWETEKWPKQPSYSVLGISLALFLLHCVNLHWRSVQHYAVLHFCMFLGSHILVNVVWFVVGSSMWMRKRNFQSKFSSSALDISLDLIPLIPCHFALSPIIAVSLYSLVLLLVCYELWLAWVSLSWETKHLVFFNIWFFQEWKSH